MGGPGPASGRSRRSRCRRSRPHALRRRHAAPSCWPPCRSRRHQSVGSLRDGLAQRVRQNERRLVLHVQIAGEGEHALAFHLAKHRTGQQVGPQRQLMPGEQAAGGEGEIVAVCLAVPSRFCTRVCGDRASAIGRRSPCSSAQHGASRTACRGSTPPQGPGGGVTCSGRETLGRQAGEPLRDHGVLASFQWPSRR